MVGVANEQIDQMWCNVFPPRHLSVGFECLDASQPWLCYWILHSLSLLHASISPSMESDVTLFLSRCQSPEGGFGGA